MSFRVVIPTKLVNESPILGANGNSPFDFVSLMAPGETISVAFVTCTVYSGTDPSPSSVISGSTTIVGTQVQQKITGGVAGVIYELACAIQTSLGQNLILRGYLAVTPDLP